MNCQQISKISHKKLNRSENISKVLEGLLFFLKQPVVILLIQNRRRNVVFGGAFLYSLTVRNKTNKVCCA